MTTINSVGTGLKGVTGTGTFVGSTSASLVTPHLGTPASGTLTSCTIANGSYSAGSPLPYLTYVDATNGEVVSVAPAASETATTAFGSLSMGTAVQNTTHYAMLLNISVVTNATTGLVLTLGVGSTSTPIANDITNSAGIGNPGILIFSFSAFVASGDYVLIDFTGAATILSITTQACAVG